MVRMTIIMMVMIMKLMIVTIMILKLMMVTVMILMMMLTIQPRAVMKTPIMVRITTIMMIIMMKLMVMLITIMTMVTMIIMLMMMVTVKPCGNEGTNYSEDDKPECKVKKGFLRNEDDRIYLFEICHHDDSISFNLYHVIFYQMHSSVFEF